MIQHMQTLMFFCKPETFFPIMCMVYCLWLENLTLKAPIKTAADDIPKYFFIVFQRK